MSKFKKKLWKMKSVSEKEERSRITTTEVTEGITETEIEIDTRGITGIVTEIITEMALTGIFSTSC